MKDFKKNVCLKLGSESERNNRFLRIVTSPTHLVHSYLEELEKLKADISIKWFQGGGAPGAQQKQILIFVK